MSRTAVNEIEVEFEVFGRSDAPAILLISGLGVQMTRWAVPFCEQLVDRGFFVVRYDNRDVGRSTHFHAAPVPSIDAVVAALKYGKTPDVPYTLRDMAMDAVGLLDALDIESGHLVGRSMGGMIGQLVAAEFPARATSLTSIMSSSGNPNLPPGDPKAVSLLRAVAPDPRLDEDAYLDHAVAVARALAGTAYPFDEAFARTQAREEARRAFDPAGVGRQFAALVADGDRRSRLKTIVTPTQVIHGDADPLVPLDCGKDTAANIHGAELRVISGMGHEIPPPLYEDIAAMISIWARFCE